MPRKYVRKVPIKKPTMRMRKYTRKPRKTIRKIPRPLGQPFPKVMNTTLVYKNSSTNLASSGLLPYQAVTWANNNMYDFDTSNVLGNKQPLYYDQLLSVDGPYKNYKVNGWKTTIKLINLSDRPLFVFFEPSTFSYFEADTPIEIENRKGVQERLLTSASNAKPIAYFSKYTSLKSVAPKTISQGENYQAPYNANPQQQIYSSLVWKTIDGSITAFQVALHVSHVFYVQLYNDDSIIS